MKVSFYAILLALFGLFALGNAGSENTDIAEASQDRLEFEHWMRWRFFPGLYPANVTDEKVNVLLANSSQFFLENLQHYQESLESVNETNIRDLILSTNFTNCQFPDDGSFWCHVKIFIEHDGPLFGSLSQIEAPDGVVLFEDSVPPTRIREYISPFLWYVMGNDWYDVYEVQIGGNPDPTRNSEDPGNTGTVNRAEEESAEERTMTTEESGETTDEIGSSASTAPLGMICSMAFVVLSCFL